MTANNRFYLQDCMNIMPLYSDNYFDLAIVDPPYGIGTHCLKNQKNRTKLAQSKNYKTYPNEPCDIPSREYFEELFRVSRNQIIWGANHFADRFNSASKSWIVWDKCIAENIHFAQCELAYCSFNCGVKKLSYRWSGMLQGDFGDTRKNETRIHPSQKPVRLYEWLLHKFSAPGEKIIDTHLGSGSSAIAAHYAANEFVGIEIDSDYFRAFTDRYKLATAQQKLL